jgi:hypothetical protein
VAVIRLPRTSPVLPLAQSGSNSAFGWSLLLVVLLIVMFFAIGMLRKWISKVSDEGEAPKVGFTLGDLRRMRDEGQITEEEFERARTQMIAATQRAADRAAQQAVEAAKSKGVTSATVTDIEELRQRARRHREGAGGAPDGPTPPGQDPAPPTT